VCVFVLVGTGTSFSFQLVNGRWKMEGVSSRLPGLDVVFFIRKKDQPGFLSGLEGYQNIFSRSPLHHA
jgi:hypothetical protein